MSLVNRKVTFRLYPTSRQLERLEQMVVLHQRLYNAALEQRIDAYRRQKKSLSFSDQCKELTLLRQEMPEYQELNAQSCQVTLRRLDRAFKNFFMRLKQGAAKAGFPRFKSKDRFTGFGYKTHGDGFRLESGGKHGYLRLSGAGRIKIRGKARTPGEVRTAELIRKGDRWYVSVTLKCSPKRKSGTRAIGIDWGVETFATLAHSDGSFEELKNPRYLKKSLKLLKRNQQSLAKKKPGSKNRKRAICRVRKIHQKIADQRKNHSHQTSAAMIQQAAMIATESLSVKGMTASGGEHKKGLNREILNTAPGMFFSFLKYKAEEAGVFWSEIPTRKVKPSQTCSSCGKQEKKLLSQREHSCECGLKLSRDQNAARVILNWALNQRATGWEPSSCGGAAIASSLNQETPSIFA